MTCKNCGAELRENAAFCTVCGAQIEPAAQDAEPKTLEAVEPAPVEEVKEPKQEKNEKKEKKSGLSAGQLAIIIVVCAALLAVMVALVVSGMKQQPESLETPTADTTPTESTPADTEPTEEPTVPANGNPNDETCKGTYTVSDDEAIAARDTVVATWGDCELTNSLLQVYYWNQFYDLLDYYGDYVLYIGLDPTLPHDVQLFTGDSTRTWQQYFLASGITNWMRYQALAYAADHSSDFELDAEYVTYLNNLETSLSSSAQANGFGSVTEMLQADMGVGCTFEDFKRYSELYYKGYQYFNDELDKLPITDEDIEAYYTEHEAELIEYGYGKDAGHTVDVRHILLIPADSEDASWETCRVEAEALLETWKNGEATEESFAALATENTQDPGSMGTGGLYEGVEKGTMVAEFNDWCFDESRQPGDYGLVKTTYGYHLMYFVGAAEEIWYTQSKNGLANERGSKLIDDVMAQFTSSINYKAVKLGKVETASE